MRWIIAIGLLIMTAFGYLTSPLGEYADTEPAVATTIALAP
jgi:hypothetical protein